MQRVVSNFQATAAELAGCVDTYNTPADLRACVMQAISRENPPEPAAPKPQIVSSVGGRLIDNRWLRLMAPLTATAAMVLVVVAVILNVRITNEVDDLKRENSSLQANLDSSVATISAQVAQAAVNESEVMNSVLKLQQASYELAQPDNMSLELSPTAPESSSQGILLVTRDGSRGVIMVAGMKPPSPSMDYHVWLMSGQDKLWVGQVGVDSQGWGTVSLQLPQPNMDFEKVELTADNNTVDPQKNMALQGNLVSINNPQMVT